MSPKEIISGILYFITVVTWSYCASNTEYLLIPEVARYTYQNPEYSVNSSVNIRRINRTTLALSVVLNCIRDMEEPEFHVEFKQFLNNEFKSTGITFDLLLCDLLGDPDLNVYKKFMSDGVHGNITECENTLPKGYYFVKDAVVSSKIKKSIFMPGKWKTDFLTKDANGETIFIGEAIIRIEEIITN